MSIPKRFEERNRVQLCLNDELKDMGSGFRSFFVKEGRKWVFLHDPYLHRTKRLTKNLYTFILTQTQKRRKRNGTNDPYETH